MMNSTVISYFYVFILREHLTNISFVVNVSLSAPDVSGEDVRICNSHGISTALNMTPILLSSTKIFQLWYT